MESTLKSHYNSPAMNVVVLSPGFNYLQVTSPNFGDEDGEASGSDYIIIEG